MKPPETVTVNKGCTNEMFIQLSQRDTLPHLAIGGRPALLTTYCVELCSLKLKRVSGRQVYCIWAEAGCSTVHCESLGDSFLPLNAPGDVVNDAVL